MVAVPPAGFPSVTLGMLTTLTKGGFGKYVLLQGADQRGIVEMTVAAADGHLASFIRVPGEAETGAKFANPGRDLGAVGGVAAANDNAVGIDGRYGRGKQAGGGQGSRVRWL